MRAITRARRGVTLLELVVALAIVGLSSAIVLLAWQWPTTDASIEPGAADVITEARRRAVATGRTQRLRLRLTGEGTVIPLDDRRPGSMIRFAMVRPDGSVLAEPAFAFAPLSGRVLPASPATP